MNTGTMIHAKKPSVMLEFVHFDNFVSTKVTIFNAEDGSEHQFDVLSEEEPNVRLLPARHLHK